MITSAVFPYVNLFSVMSRYTALTSERLSPSADSPFSSKKATASLYSFASAAAANPPIPSAATQMQAAAANQTILRVRFAGFAGVRPAPARSAAGISVSAAPGAKDDASATYFSSMPPIISDIFSLFILLFPFRTGDSSGQSGSSTAVPKHNACSSRTPRQDLRCCRRGSTA